MAVMTEARAVDVEQEGQPSKLEPMLVERGISSVAGCLCLKIIPFGQKNFFIALAVQRLNGVRRGYDIARKNCLYSGVFGLVPHQEA